MKNSVKWLLMLLIIGLLPFYSCGNKKEQPSEEELAKEISKPAVRITVGEFYASGIIISVDEKNTYIATVSHLTEGYDQCIVTFQNNKSAFADVIWSDAKSDISLLRIDNSLLDSDFVKSELIACDVSKERKMSKGDTVYLVGSVISAGGNVMKGSFGAYDYYVIEYDSYYTYLYCDASSGMSGSGCFDSEGNLFGIVSAGSEAGETLCIPIEDYIKIMEENRNDQD